MKRKYKYLIVALCLLILSTLSVTILSAQDLNVTITNHYTAISLMVNHQAHGLAPNWNIYQASLNYADYPTTHVLRGEGWDGASGYVGQ